MITRGSVGGEPRAPGVWTRFPAELEGARGPPATAATRTWTSSGGGSPGQGRGEPGLPRGSAHRREGGAGAAAPQRWGLESTHCGRVPCPPGQPPRFQPVVQGRPLHCPPGWPQGGPSLRCPQHARASYWAKGFLVGRGEGAVSVRSQRPGATVLWEGGPRELWGPGSVALAGTGVLEVLERPSWSFLCSGPPDRPWEGTLDSDRNGAGTFISGERAGTRVGGQASGRGASPRPHSWVSAGMPDS